MNDRRTGRDRRAVARYAAEIDVEWEGLIGRRSGTISDISPMGCFVLCSGEVEDGENIKILFPMPSGRTLPLWGEVVNHVFEIGFGVRFIELSEAQREFLEQFVSTLAETDL
jgi:hypothetical protein